MKKTLEEQIRDALESQRFFDWYTKDFDSYLVGDTNCKTKEQILEDIRRIFRLETGDK